MNAIASPSEKPSIDPRGVASAVAGILALAAFSVSAPYLVGYTAAEVPKMQPILVFAALAAMAFYACALSEHLLISLGGPPFPVCERVRGRLFAIVALVSIGSFALVIDIPMPQAWIDYYNEYTAATLAGLDYEGDGVGLLTGSLFALVQPIFLIVVYRKMRKRGMRRSPLLSTMLLLVFLGYLIQVFVAELIVAAVLLVALAAAIPLVIALLPFLVAAGTGTGMGTGRRYYD